LLEPLASPEEVAEYEVDEAVAEDEQLENMLQNRFECHVDVSSWLVCVLICQSNKLKRISELLFCIFYKV
jgi:hypothetical protein